ncbi:tRNA (uracil-5-)-methyltransferase [Strigomonas culicis]|uniref:tRNA (Uracil-5-)-methyltransferase n=1 Tax=Strigomonas culicis TaxID=28005 RepID=S9UQY6_9TRYP|nr:tRNA (uracil-5-)-methyltransferase [Strigomonas culicis]|eukprot:EPY33347.1 tRNA (uracil-5-)-methyltransferase [Strigomonas culicis]
MNKNPKTEYLYLAFENEKDRADAAELLKTIKYRGRFWEEARVTDKDLSVTHKGTAKRPRPSEEGSKLTQYESYTIEEQHAIKTKSCLSTMRSIVPPFAYGREEYMKRFQGIVESPQLTGYRNHVNLSFGLTDKNEPAVGFQKGALVEGRSAIESATEGAKDVVTMHPIAKAAAQEVMNIFQEFRSVERGSLGVFDKIKGEGFWRRLQIRHNIYGEVLMDLEVDADSTTPEVFNALLNRLKEIFTSLEITGRLQKVWGGERARVIGLLYHKHSGIGSLADNAERVCVFGDSVLTEYVNGLKFELSPTAFFQVNTPGMEKMLEKVSQVAELTSSTTLLDLCSGTGTIGLSLANM